MRIIRALIALALTTGVLVPAASRAAETVKARPDVVLKGRTTITTRTSGKLLIRLPSKVDFLKDFHTDVEGSGRLYGFTFWKAGGEFLRDPSVEHIWTGFCLERGCKPKDDIEGITWGYGFASYLPAGDYEMYVVTDGAPLTVTFKIDTLSGKTSARPRTIRSEFQAATPTISRSELGHTYSGGMFSEMEKSDISYFFMWAIDGNDTATAFGDCSYYGGTARSNIPKEGAFLPGCPTGDGSQPFVHEGPDGGIILQTADYTGAEGLGAWFVAGNSHDRYGAVAAWLDI